MGAFSTVPPAQPDVVPVTINLAGNPFWETVEATAASREIVLQIYCESEHYLGDYTHLITMRKFSGTDSNCHFRIDTILKNWLEQQTELPNLEATAAALLKRNVVNYFVHYAEIDPATEEPVSWTVGRLKAVMKGQLPVEDFQPIASYLNFTKEFLTWSAPVKEIGKSQPEFLYFLNTSAERTEIVIKRKVFAVGSPVGAEATENVVLGANSRFRIAAMPVYAGNTANVEKVEIQLFSTMGTAISEKRTYTYKSRLGTVERYFVFENSLGCFDTIRTTGHRESALDGKAEVAERTVTPGWKTELGQYFVYNQNNTRKIKQSSGFHDKVKQSYLQEFAMSKKRFEVIRFKLRPIIISKVSLDNQDDTRSLFAFSFEFDYAFDPAYANYRAYDTNIADPGDGGGQTQQ